MKRNVRIVDEDMCSVPVQCVAAWLNRRCHEPDSRSALLDADC